MVKDRLTIYDRLLITETAIKHAETKGRGLNPLSFFRRLFLQIKINYIITGRPVLSALTVGRVKEYMKQAGMLNNEQTEPVQISEMNFREKLEEVAAQIAADIGGKLPIEIMQGLTQRESKQLIKKLLEKKIMSLTMLSAAQSAEATKSLIKDLRQQVSMISSETSAPKIITEPEKMAEYSIDGKILKRGDYGG